MDELLIKIITVICTSVIIPLITFFGTQLIKLIKSKVKNTNVSTYTILLTEIVTNTVKSVLQTYVSTLKKNNCFDEKCQVEALEKAKAIVLSQMNSELQDFVRKTYGDIDEWLVHQIESTIHSIKNNSNDN